VTYPASPTTANRSLPLLVTLQASMLSHQSPQVRFVLRGTAATFVKHGIDPQEAQLVKGGTYGPTGRPEPGAVGVTDERFGVESEALEGTLYTAEGGEKVPTEKGSYICRSPPHPPSSPPPALPVDFPPFALALTTLHPHPFPSAQPGSETSPTPSARPTRPSSSLARARPS